jgi:hypothetical protein
MNARHVHSIPGISALALLLSLVGVTSCGACNPSSNDAPAPSEAAHVPLGGSAEREPEAVPSVADNSEREQLPEGFEFGPADIQLRQFAGEMDVKNRYASTVMLSLKDPRALPDCSGILLDPRLVLRRWK